jgi:hypothetical protein
VGADPQLQTALTTTGRALLVGALDAEELAEAVAGPAARTGRPLPPDAVALLVREAEGQAGALPLLQFTLEKLWKAIDDAPSRPIAELLERAGRRRWCAGERGRVAVSRASSRLAEVPGCVRAVAERAQVRARRTFSRLLQTSEGQVLGRRRQTLADLVGDGETLADVRAVLDRFVASRLLVLDGEGAEAMVEIGHESLGRSWQRLAQWLGEAAAYLPVLLRLSEDARRWQKQGQPGSVAAGEAMIWPCCGRRCLMLEASGDLGAGERGFALACVRGVKHRRQKQAAALVKQRVLRAVSIARHVVDRVMTRLQTLSGTAELRKELLADAMRELDSLRTEVSDGISNELLSLRAEGHTRRGDVAMTHDNLATAFREYEAARLIGEGLLRHLPSVAGPAGPVRQPR